MCSDCPGTAFSKTSMRIYSYRVKTQDFRVPLLIFFLDILSSLPFKPLNNAQRPIVCLDAVCCAVSVALCLLVFCLSIVIVSILSYFYAPLNYPSRTNKVFELNYLWHFFVRFKHNKCESWLLIHFA